jgi:hypothetical protein
VGLADLHSLSTEVRGCEVKSFEFWTEGTFLPFGWRERCGFHPAQRQKRLATLGYLKNCGEEGLGLVVIWGALGAGRGPFCPFENFGQVVPAGLTTEPEPLLPQAPTTRASKVLLLLTVAAWSLPSASRSQPFAILTANYMLATFVDSDFPELRRPAGRRQANCCRDG